MYLLLKFHYTQQNSYHQKKTRVRIWIYEDVHVQMEGIIIGFDEYMNVVLDDAIEINTNSKQQQQKRINVGRCLLKGDAITLIQLRIYVYMCVHINTMLCTTTREYCIDSICVITHLFCYFYLLLYMLMFFIARTLY